MQVHLVKRSYVITEIFAVTGDCSREQAVAVVRGDPDAEDLTVATACVNHAASAFTYEAVTVTMSADRIALDGRTTVEAEQ